MKLQRRMVTLVDKKMRRKEIEEAAKDRKIPLILDWLEDMNERLNNQAEMIVALSTKLPKNKE